MFLKTVQNIDKKITHRSIQILKISMHRDLSKHFHQMMENSHLKP